MPEVEVVGADTLRRVIAPDFHTVVESFDNFCFARFPRGYIYPPEDYSRRRTRQNR